MIEYVSKRIYLSNSRKQMQLLHIEMAQMPNKASFLFLPTCLHLFSENNLLAPSINRLPNAAYLQVAQQLVLLLQIKMNIETDQILPSCACPTSYTSRTKLAFLLLGTIWKLVVVVLQLEMNVKSAADQPHHLTEILHQYTLYFTILLSKILPLQLGTLHVASCNWASYLLAVCTLYQTMYLTTSPSCPVASCTFQLATGHLAPLWPNLDSFCSPLNNSEHGMSVILSLSKRFVLLILGLEHKYPRLIHTNTHKACCVKS